MNSNNMNFAQMNLPQQQSMMFPGMMTMGGGGFPQQPRHQHQMGFIGSAAPSLPANAYNNAQLQPQYQNQMIGIPQQQAYGTSTFGQMAINSAPSAQPPGPVGAQPPPGLLGVQPPPPPGTPPPQNVDDNEQQKINMLQTQAKIWQERNRIAEQQEAISKRREEEFLKQVAEEDPEVACCLEEEKQFQEQYETWKKQFDEWKEQNKDHPDREQYAQYEKQWRTYEQQMDAQKSDLAKKRESAVSHYRAKMSDVNNGPGASSASQPPAAANRHAIGPGGPSSGPRGQRPSEEMRSNQTWGSQSTMNDQWPQGQRPDVQSQEAQAMVRQRHPLSHLQRRQQLPEMVQPQQGNLRQPRPNAHEHMPNMPHQQHPGMRRQNPNDKQHSNIHQQQPNLGCQRPDVSQQRPNIGQQRPNMGQQRPNMGQQRPNMGQQRPNMGQQRPNMGKQRPNTSQQPNTDFQQSNTSQLRPNTGQLRPNMGPQRPSMSQHQPSINQQRPNLSQQRPNMNQHRPTINPQRPNLRQQQPDADPQHPNIRQQRPNMQQHHPSVSQQRPDMRHQHPDVRQQQNRLDQPGAYHSADYPGEDYYIDYEENERYGQRSNHSIQHEGHQDKFYEDSYSHGEFFDNSEKQQLTKPQQPLQTTVQSGKGGIASLMSVNEKPPNAASVNNSAQTQQSGKGQTPTKHHDAKPAEVAGSMVKDKEVVSSANLQTQIKEPATTYDEQKKLIGQLMGSAGMAEEEAPSFVKADPSMIPEHKKNKPVFAEISTQGIVRSTLSMVLPAFNSAEKEVRKDEGNEKQPTGTVKDESVMDTSSTPPPTEASNVPASSAMQTVQSASHGPRTSAAAMLPTQQIATGAPGSWPGASLHRPGMPGQHPGATGQRLRAPGQRPDGFRPRFVQPNQRPGALGQSMHRQRFEGSRQLGPRSFDENCGQRYPPPRQRGSTATSSYQQPSPHLIADAVKSLSNHEHDMLKKATEGLRMQSIPRLPGHGEEAPQPNLEQDEEYQPEYHGPPLRRGHPDGPYPGEPMREPVPRRRNLLTMADGYEPGDRLGIDRPPMRRRHLDEPFERDHYGRDTYDDYGPPPPRRFGDPYERLEAYRPEERLRRERDGWGSRYYDDDLPPLRPRPRGLLLDDPYASRLDDPYDDPYVRPAPLHGPYGAEREMMHRRLHRDLPRDSYLRARDPYSQDPLHREHLLREHPLGEHPLRDHPLRDHPLRDHPLRDALLREADRDPLHRNSGPDPSITAREPLLVGHAAAALNPEVIDYSHRQPPLRLPERGIDERSKMLANINRQDSPPPGFKERSPIRLAQSPPSIRPQEADLFDAYSSLSVPHVTDIRDLICKPKRDSRPPHICLIVRGPPGAGKTHCSKLIRDKEAANGGSAPRILNLDDYFMVEVERLITDEDTGRKMKRKMLEYEYEPEMEESYRADFFKSFKKTVDKGFFSFIIVDAVNDKVRHFEEFAKFARSKSFQVYVIDVKCDSNTCFARNIHNRTLKDIEKIIAEWEETPPYFNKVDMRGLLQDTAIDDVEMEDKKASDVSSSSDSSSSDDDDELIQVAKKSKWDMDTDDHKLDKLDGLLHKKADTVRNMEDFLTLPDDYESKARGDDGKKHVRWADLEEKRLQDRDREIGFVVGQTNWNRMLDDDYADKQMNQTKYI